VIRVLDRADLVVLGAEAAGLDPYEVADEVDVGALVMVEAQLAGARTVPAAAASALVTIAARRPFPRDNRAAAWLAAAHVVALNGWELELDIGLAVLLVDDAAAGRRDERAVASVLADHLRSPRSARLRRLAARAAALARSPQPPQPPELRCPLCHRPLRRTAIWQQSPWAVVPRHQLIGGCLRQHGVHDRHGRAAERAAEPVRDQAVPLVRGRVDDTGSEAFVALTGQGPVLLCPAGTGAGDRPVTYDLFVLDELSLSGLVGRWDRLLQEREPVARIELEDGPLDPSRAALDWDEVRTLSATGRT
jgi:hypothetical protein